MIYSAITQGPQNHPLPCEVFTLKRSLTLGLATSIDALASGVAIAFLQLNIFGLSSLSLNLLIIFGVIALVTIVASLIGLKLGTKSKAGLGAKAEILGGAILIAIGLKVLFEHLIA